MCSECNFGNSKLFCSILYQIAGQRLNKLIDLFKIVWIKYVNHATFFKSYVTHLKNIFFIFVMSQDPNKKIC